ncbi:MAG: retroviral-like aspartic protease family protein [Saprospiraceae bacterium]|nr:retroviral-like aspartic protease family protein [Saprospiraceae bacterium]
MIKYKALSFIFVIFCFLLSCRSCKSDKPDTSYLDTSTYETTDIENIENSIIEQSIEIPFTEQYGNTITIPVKINGMSLEMIYDTGASSTMITLAEARYLYEKGNLKYDDIIDYQQFQTANGQIETGLRINLKNVQIGDKINLYDIEAVVVQNQLAPLLLGQSVMKHFKEISIDRENKFVKFYK